MYSSSLKKLAEEIEKVHIPDEFKFYDDEIDLMEIYEELFDYSFEVKNNLPLGSNFKSVAENYQNILKFLETKLKDKKIGEVCTICYNFCIEIKNYINKN